MADQRERDLRQWDQQRESESGKRERDREDEIFRWFREQKLKCYLEALDCLKKASELSANTSPQSQEAGRPYARVDEMAIVQELRNSYKWMGSVNAVCGEQAAEKVSKISEEIYFMIQTVTYEGIKPGQMVRLPPGKRLREWILSEAIDGISARLSDILRADLGSK